MWHTPKRSESALRDRTVIYQYFSQGFQSSNVFYLLGVTPCRLCLIGFDFLDLWHPPANPPAKRQGGVLVGYQDLEQIRGRRRPFQNWAPRDSWTCSDTSRYTVILGCGTISQVSSWISLDPNWRMWSKGTSDGQAVVCWPSAVAQGCAAGRRWVRIGISLFNSDVVFKHSNSHLEMVNFVGQFWSIPIWQNIGVRFRCGDSVGHSAAAPLAQTANPVAVSQEPDWRELIAPQVISHQKDMEHPRSVDHFGTGKPQICIAMFVYWRVCSIRLSYP